MTMAELCVEEKVFASCALHCNTRGLSWWQVNLADNKDEHWEVVYGPEIMTDVDVSGQTRQLFRWWCDGSILLDNKMKAHVKCRVEYENDDQMKPQAWDYKCMQEPCSVQQRQLAIISNADSKAAKMYNDHPTQPCIGVPSSCRWMRSLNNVDL